MSESAAPATTPATLIDVKGIQKLIPHRYPFLLVDRVVMIEKGKKLVAIKSVTINEPFFQGHFPGFPVMPGVLIVEALAQAAAILAVESMAATGGDADLGKGKVPYLASLDAVKFRRPVVPGDRLELHVEVIKGKGSIWKYKGQAIVDGKVVTEAEIMAVISDREG
jgi:3-hydroxyacyl-[acyl-carrier-protein] dehydratase